MPALVLLRDEATGLSSSINCIASKEEQWHVSLVLIYRKKRK